MEKKLKVCLKVETWFIMHYYIDGCLNGDKSEKHE